MPATILGPEDSTPSDSYFQRLRNGLSKTRKILTTDINQLFIRNKRIDDDLLEELEELLITADIGVETALELIQSIAKKSSRIQNAAALESVLKEELLSMLESRPPVQEKAGTAPYTIMVVGVNGVGKTTTIGKLAAKYTAAKKNVLIAAADTFRAAAIEQLGIWAERAGADFVKHRDGSDPAAVAYDGMEAARARGADIVIVDTAGRLHTRKNLMEELKKIKRILAKKLPGAPHEILLVLDATTGQNALSQAQLFNDALGVTGIALTKLDGTAKGGIVISIFRTLQIPIKYVGVGEKIEDLQHFDPEQFIKALL
ncbi:MAG: signal recognition particle-docking protein FtsY [Desulfobacterales bacterium]|jgi:fused signal recognition particle receptor